jgi:hypothetical protein
VIHTSNENQDKKSLKVKNKKKVCLLKKRKSRRKIRD